MTMHTIINTLRVCMRVYLRLEEPEQSLDRALMQPS
jgi:hypothetical protein